MWRTSRRGREKEAERGKKSTMRKGGEERRGGRQEIKTGERNKKKRKGRARPAGRAIWPDCHLTGGI